MKKVPILLSLRAWLLHEHFGKRIYLLGLVYIGFGDPKQYVGCKLGLVRSLSYPRGYSQFTNKKNTSILSAITNILFSLDVL